MKKIIETSEVLFEVSDVFGKRIRTTKRWWKHIIEEKHRDVEGKVELVQKTISLPDEIRQSIKKTYIYLYYRNWEDYWMCVVVRRLNGDGFLMTVYITTKTKKRGKLVWQKVKNK